MGGGGGIELRASLSLTTPKLHPLSAMHVNGQIVYLAISLFFSSLIWTALDIGADEKCLAAKCLAHQTSPERIISEVVFVERLIHSLI